MAKHHHQSKAEQIDNKEHNAKPFHFEKTPPSANVAPVGSDDASIAIHAYHLYKDKGGSAMENWLEAEKTIRNIH